VVAINRLIEASSSARVIADRVPLRQGRHRSFESGSLQQRVRCEVYLVAKATSPRRARCESVLRGQVFGNARVSANTGRLILD
jgi:hypothetical protein